MPRKDYVLIANVIRDLPIDRETLETIISRFIQALKEENPNFVPITFRRACMEGNKSDPGR